jgi:hypothetical protein
MISIGKNRYKVLVTITALASILLVNVITLGTDGHIALARHYDNTKVFENSHINVQTDTNQGQACETAGGASPISGSCSTSSSNTISQGAVPSPPSPTCPTIHPTVLTLNLSPADAPPRGNVEATGKLTDTCTGQGVPHVTIAFTFQFPAPPGFGLIGVGRAMTTTNGGFGLTIVIPFQAIAGTGTVHAQFGGQGILGPSSATQSFSVS